MELFTWKVLRPLLRISIQIMAVGAKDSWPPWRGPSKKVIFQRCSALASPKQLFLVVRQAIQRSTLPQPDFCVWQLKTPLLWEYNTEHVAVYFSSRLQNAFELIGRLRETVARLFDRLEPRSRFLYASPRPLPLGMGCWLADRGL